MIRPDFEKWGQKAEDIRQLSLTAAHPRSRERYQALYMIGTGQTNASQWAQTITDTSLREQSLVRIAEEWMGRNPSTTLAWLPNSGLSRAAVERIKQVAR